MQDLSRSLLRIGDLARQTGKTVRAIHLYEELGLLQPTTRSSGGFRLFEASATERVRWIDLLNGLGFSLHEMRDLLRSWWSAGLGTEAMEDLRRVFTQKLEATREQRKKLEQLEQELVSGLAYLETCKVCDSPSDVKTCVHCQHDHGMKQEPALLAGLKSAPHAGRRDPRAGLVRIEERP